MADRRHALMRMFGATVFFAVSAIIIVIVIVSLGSNRRHRIVIPDYASRGLYRSSIWTKAGVEMPIPVIPINAVENMPVL